MDTSNGPCQKVTTESADNHKQNEGKSCHRLGLCRLPPSAGVEVDNFLRCQAHGGFTPPDILRESREIVGDKELPGFAHIRSGQLYYLRLQHVSDIGVIRLQLAEYSLQVLTLGEFSSPSKMHVG